MIFEIIIITILFILLIASIYNVIEAIKIKDCLLGIIQVILAGLVGILLGLALSGNLFIFN